MPKDIKGKSAVRGSDANNADSPARTNSKPYHKRSGPSTSAGTGSSSKTKPSHANNKKYEKSQSSSGLPGASKIKSSIRQTKRLLAKPNLAPGTKIEAERRLKSLEADLEVASRKQVEKSRASRYHRVKFVERQKLVRRIARCKRNLARIESGKQAQDSDSDSDSDSDAGSDNEHDDSEQRAKESKMSKEELTRMLQWLRELLHYVVQYPADLRYVALFPNTEQGPSPPDAKEKDKSRQKAFQHLERVKKAVKEGQLSNEPEIELSSKDRPRSKLASNAPTQTIGKQTSGKKASKAADTKSPSKRKHQQESSSDEDQDDDDDAAGGVKGDDFFAQDSDDE